MNTITDEQIEFIYNDVRQKGITMPILLDEMVDHICCSIEPEMYKGTAFRIAYNNLMNNIESSTFKNVQHQTLLSTNLKFIKMKKTMFITGFLGTFFLVSGTVFKINHWPGASISLLVGMLIIVFLFLPLFFFTSYKEQVEKKNILLHIIGYLTLSFLLLGPLFRILHWPFTDFFFFYGPITLAALFLPVYLVSVFKKANETKTNYLFIIILIGIGTSTLFMLHSANLSKELLDKYDSSYHKNLRVTRLFEAKNDSLILQYSKNEKFSSQKQSVEKIQKQTTEINNFINKLMIDMIKSANVAESNLDNFNNRDDKNVCKVVMEQNNNQNVLNEKLEKYPVFLLSFAKDEYQKQVIENFLEFEDFKFEIEYYNFKKYPMIEALSRLSSIQKNIEMAEFEILNSME